MGMRVDPKQLDPFLRLMNDHRPCPKCGSDRVTVRELAGKDGRILRAECSDCGRTYDAAREPD
jgi:transposase-like protein